MALYQINGKINFKGPMMFNSSQSALPQKSYFFSGLATEAFSPLELGHNFFGIFLELQKKFFF